MWIIRHALAPANQRVVEWGRVVAAAPEAAGEESAESGRHARAMLLVISVALTATGDNISGELTPLNSDAPAKYSTAIPRRCRLD
ncbi:hypothetical protein AKJ16_DCAP06925 [Drosera capensis]